MFLKDIGIWNRSLAPSPLVRRKNVGNGRHVRGNDGRFRIFGTQFRHDLGGVLPRQTLKFLDAKDGIVNLIVDFVLALPILVRVLIEATKKGTFGRFPSLVHLADGPNAGLSNRFEVFRRHPAIVNLLFGHVLDVRNLKDRIIIGKGQVIPFEWLIIIVVALVRRS